MKSKYPKRQTRSEAAYVRDMARSNAFEMVDRGHAKLVRPDALPEPLKRFRARERSAVVIRLPATARRHLRLLSRARGIAMEELAKQWVEQGLEREAG